MTRLLVVGGIVVIAVVVALVLQRRRPAPPANRTFTAPTQLDRRDFPRPDAPWLVAVFTSSTCNACAAVWSAAAGLGGTEVSVVELESITDAELHKRYRIDAVPTAVIAGPTGIVEWSTIGPVADGELRDALERLRTNADPAS